MAVHRAKVLTTGHRSGRDNKSHRVGVPTVWSRWPGCSLSFNTYLSNTERGHGRCWPLETKTICSQSSQCTGRKENPPLSLSALTNKSTGHLGTRVKGAFVRREKRKKEKVSDTSDLRSVLKAICWEGHLPGQGVHVESWKQEGHSKVSRCAEGLAHSGTAKDEARGVGWNPAHEELCVPWWGVFTSACGYREPQKQVKTGREGRFACGSSRVKDGLKGKTSPWRQEDCLGRCCNSPGKSWKLTLHRQ